MSLEELTNYLEVYCRHCEGMENPGMRGGTSGWRSTRRHEKLAQSRSRINRAARSND